MSAATAEHLSGAIIVETVIEAGDWPDVGDLLAQAASAAWAVAGDGKAAEVSVSLTDDDAIKQLNQDFRGNDTATDVLSFPAGEAVLPGEEAMLGDIALALNFIRRESALESKTFDDHLVHLFVHGLLHLIGYDHEQTADAVQMEHIEQIILAQLGITDPYAGRELDRERQ
jgi:probable rRNA maturation factor